MFSKKLLCTVGVLAATALAPAAAHAAPTDAPREVNRGTQVGSEGIIAVLIGLAHSPADIATDGIGVGYRVRGAGAPSQIEPTSLEVPNIA